MELFDEFEAVKFPQENLIFITKNGYLYYLYYPQYHFWRKHQNAGNDHITVANYPDVSKKELADAMQGKFPKKETDFMRLCNPSQLWIRDMLALLKEDYTTYMSDYNVYCTIHHFLLESDICYKSYEKIRKLMDAAVTNQYSTGQVINKTKELSFEMIGRDIFRSEIGIVDGHDSSSYFWIMPVKVIDYTNTNAIDNVAQMKSAEISIEEDDVAQYLTPFLYEHYDDELEANQKRIEDHWIDDDGKVQYMPISGFEWYLTHNFFTFDSMKRILRDITDTADALTCGRETEYTKKLKIKRGTDTYQLLYAKNLSEEEIAEYNANRPTEDTTEVGLIVDFFHRFVYRMEYMIRVGKEKGYDLISFMGP